MTYRHYYPVLDLGRVHARSEEEAMEIAVERALDLGDTFSWRDPANLIGFTTVGPCLPSCDEHEEYLDEVP